MSNQAFVPNTHREKTEQKDVLRNKEEICTTHYEHPIH